MIWPIVVALVLVLVMALIVAVAREPGPSAVDVALGYEHAWDRLDFDAIYRMSGAELRDGLSRSEYVTAERAAYHAGRAGRAASSGRLVAVVAAETVRQEGGTAVVVTRLALRDGSVVHHEVRLLRAVQDWLVIAYELRPDPA